MKEIWKDIEGYEGLYQVSNLGRVKRNGRILKPEVHSKGYLRVQLYKNGKCKHFTIHRLVAEAFIPNPEKKPQVNHIDEDKTNNVVSNIEWVTHKENINHGTRTVRSAISRGHKIKAIDIANGEYNIYYSISKCAKQLNLNRSNIHMCLEGKRRQTGGYVFEYAE